LIAEDRPVSIERETFPALAEQGRLFGFPTDDYWLDAGTPMAYVQANLDLVNGVRAAEVAIDSSAVIDAGATVTNSVVMAGAHVAEGAVVENSVVMAGASIGPNTAVADSVVAEGAEVGAGSEIREFSMVGFGEVVPAGTVLIGSTAPDSSSW
jgi:mannose-1-phosphate guanylyltransferase